MAEWRPISAVLGQEALDSPPPRFPAVLDDGADQSAPLFLYIPVSRLILNVRIFSFGLYEAYWDLQKLSITCKNGLQSLRLKSDPCVTRLVCGILFCHGFLCGGSSQRSDRQFLSSTPTFSPGILATGWVVLAIFAKAVGRIPADAAVIISTFIPSCLCLVPVQNYVNSVTERRNPDLRPTIAGHRATPSVWAFGVIIWIFRPGQGLRTNETRRNAEQVCADTANGGIPRQKDLRQKNKKNVPRVPSFCSRFFCLKFFCSANSIG